jgi:hypothetical protein
VVGELKKVIIPTNEIKINYYAFNVKKPSPMFSGVMKKCAVAAPMKRSSAMVANFGYSEQ